MGCGAKCNFCGTLNSVCRCSGGNPVLINKNTTEVIPVGGKDAYEIWKAYNPESTWTEAEWLDRYVEGQLVYETFEI